MRTEEYIIILAGVVAADNQLTITYSSNAPEDLCSIRVTDDKGKECGRFDRVRPADKGIVTMPLTGLQAGNYTCEISHGGRVSDSRTFVVE
ncbi:MAG: hypothetical protein EOO01_36035 [Chitinophagaceae bacterium]|nr:MAG: hypothetical protein EOO01_36035 [Chitinophagaceae bacterium]